MLQKTAEYALRATVWLAQEPGAPTPATRLRGRFVCRAATSTRFCRAGTCGHRPLAAGPARRLFAENAADKTTILDVITAVGPLQRIRRCPLGLESHTDLCPLHRELDDAFAAMEQAFTRVTVADVVNRPSPITPLREVIASGMPALTTPVSPDCRDSGMPPNRE